MAQAGSRRLLGRSTEPGTPGGGKHTGLVARIRRWKERDHETLAAGLFIFPNLVGFLIFTAIPVGAAFVLAFYNYDLLLGGSPAGLENFRQLLGDEVFHAAFINTAYFTVSVVVLSVVLGLGAAILVNQSLRFMVIFRTIFLLPYITLTVALALVWRWLYLPDIGLVNQVLGIVGIDGPNWLTSPTWAMPALIIMSVWKGFGYNMVLFLAGLQTVPQHLYEAASIDGANAWRRFWHVTLPMLSPVTFFVVVISIIGSFQVFDQAFVMTQGGPGTSTTTLVLYIYEVGFQEFEMGYAAAVALVLFATIFIFTLIQFMLQRKWVTYE
jgi:multiple sugar transport system permease protein